MEDKHKDALSTHARTIMRATETTIRWRIEHGGSVWGDDAEVMEQASWIHFAVVARYNIPLCAEILRVFLDDTLEYPYILDNDEALADWHDEHATDALMEYYEAADTVATIMSALGDVSLSALIMLSEFYKESTRIELLAHTIARIGGPIASAALKRMVAEYPVFKQPFFTSPDMAWQIEMWNRMANEDDPTSPDPALYVGCTPIPLREIIHDDD
jgi:hypothetical protein